MTGMSRVNDSTKVKVNSNANKNIQPPAAFFIPASLTITDYLDRKSLIMLTDGKTFIGEIMSCDVYGNVVVDNCFERIFVGEKYGDDPTLSSLVFKSENIALICEIDETGEMEPTLKKVPFKEIYHLHQVQVEQFKLENMTLKANDEFHVISDHPFKFLLYDES